MIVSTNDDIITNAIRLLQQTAIVTDKYVKFTYPQGYNRRIKITNFDNWVKKNGPYPAEIQSIFNAMSKIVSDVCDVGVDEASKRDISRRYGNKEEIIKLEFIYEVKKDGSRIRHFVFDESGGKGFKVKHQIIVDIWNGSEYVDAQEGIIEASLNIARSSCGKYIAFSGNPDKIYQQI